MSISLRDVTKDNWVECTKLQVAPEQQHFVASNLESIAESRFYPSFHPQAIYQDEEMVGFVMWGTNPHDGRMWIRRLMIDQRLQGKGYGRGAMEGIIRILRDDPACPEVYLRYAPENGVGERLYESLGFRKTGAVDHGSIVMCLRFDRTGGNAPDATPDNSPPQ